MIRAQLKHDLDTSKGMLKAGTIFEGEEAKRFLAAGLAIPVVEKRVETNKPNKAVETR